MTRGRFNIIRRVDASEHRAEQTKMKPVKLEHRQAKKDKKIK
jgi:hypothetical protein